ncbi:hypothetical protein [Weissella viridescens]|uniref:hypothetical protein n=1 Tax=Weissella viridescens TaxID=1629 RepID=UPI003AF2F93D
MWLFLGLGLSVITFVMLNFLQGADASGRDTVNLHATIQLSVLNGVLNMGIIYVIGLLINALVN